MVGLSEFPSPDDDWLERARVHARRAYATGMTPLEISARWSEEVRRRLPESLAATGSFGRGEATFSSDLDLIQVSEVRTGEGIATMRPWIDPDLPFTRLFPRSAEDWREQVQAWANHPERNRGVVLTGLLADAAHPVNAAVYHTVPGTPMVAEMLRDALSVTVPRLSGPLSRGAFELKKELIVPVVKIARWAALASGVNETSTLDRLAVVDGRFLTPEHAEYLWEAFLIAFSCRSEFDLVEPVNVRHTSTGLLILASLTKDRRRELERAARDVRRVQRVLKYGLSTSSFSGKSS